MIPAVNVNFIAVFVAAIASMIIGFVWYSPFAFGKMWMGEMGISAKKVADKKKKQNMPVTLGISFIAALVMAYVLAHIISYAQAKTVLEGAQAGFWLWLGFVATTMLSSVLFGGKSVKLFIINSAHYLVVLLVMGAILTVRV